MRVSQLNTRSSPPLFCYGRIYLWQRLTTFILFERNTGEQTHARQTLRYTVLKHFQSHHLKSDQLSECWLPVKQNRSDENILWSPQLTFSFYFNLHALYADIYAVFWLLTNCTGRHGSRLLPSSVPCSFTILSRSIDVVSALIRCWPFDRRNSSLLGALYAGSLKQKSLRC